jgi:hypothetical protein
MGREVETPKHVNDRAGSTKETTGWNTDLSCGAYLPELPRDLPGHKLGLSKGDGFLYFGDAAPAARTLPILYFPHGAAKGIELPIPRWQLRPVSISRMASRSYLLYGPHRERPSSGWNICPKSPVERTIYLLSPDGTVKRILIPAEEALRCYVDRFDVVRAGVLVFKGGGHVRDLDLSRLYLLRKSRLVEVTHGVISDHHASPNGCRLALGISSTDDPKRPTSAPTYRGHLKVIDFCSKGEK